MTRQQLAQIEMVAKVVVFARMYDSRIPQGSLLRDSFDRMVAVKARIASLGALPGRAGARPGTRGRDAARDVLQARLKALHRTMRAVAIDHPGIEVNFRLPRRRRQDQRMIKAAQEFIKYATPLKQEFVAYRLPEDFLERLAADIDGLVQAIVVQGQGMVDRKVAAENLRLVLREANVVMRRLNAIIANMFRWNTEVITAWESAREVRKTRRRVALRAKVVTTKIRWLPPHVSAVVRKSVQDPECT